MFVHGGGRILLYLVLILAAACQGGPRLATGTGRSVWVDRWDYRTAADIGQIMEDCRRAGFSAVMFQVRGNGTVSYPSAIEVWSERFAYQDPGFDPLGVAVKEAHARGLELHAWVNLMPGWVGAEVPASPQQLWNARPGWFLQDRESRRQPPAAGKYLALNPCLPEVRSYLTDLCRELAARYEVDGLHLDYVRFPDPEPGAGMELGVDPVSIAMFTGATGRRASDRDALRRWQAACVTRMVADIGAAVRAQRPAVKLSAAVFADPDLALEKVRQEWPVWCRRGLVDEVFPMNYTGDDARFLAQAEQAVRAAAGVPVIMGIGVYKLQAAGQGSAQLDAALAAGARGVGIFSYRALFGRSDEVPPARQAALRQDIGGWIEAAGRR